MSDTSTEVAVRTGGALAVGADQTAWTEQQLAVLRSAGVSEEVTKAELDVFLHECQRTRLDPFSKQIYLIGRYDNQLRRKAFRSQTGIDGYRVVAHRVAREDKAELEYEETLWCGPDGKWRDMWIWDKPPLAAKVVVLKDGKRYPAVATLAEYATTDRDGNLTSMWRRMPANQLEKCAEAKALRRAFPNDLGGIYTAEEMEQADAGESRPQELTVEQAAAKMRRNKGKQADDEWNTEPGAGVDGPDNKTLQRIAILITDKFGTLKREDRLAHLARLVGRELASSKDISLVEARTVIADLEKLPDHIADAEVVEDGEPIVSEPNPRNGDAGKPLEPSLFVPSLQSLLIDSRGENGPTVAASLDGLIAKATTPMELEAIWKVVDEAHKAKHLNADEFANLNTLGQAKDRELSGAAPAPQQQPGAPTAQQYEAADSFKARIRRVSDLEALNALHGTLTEARDGGSITAIQFGVLEAQMDDRYQVLAKAAGMAPDRPGGSWSHRMLADSGATL